MICQCLLFIPTRYPLVSSYMAWKVLPAWITPGAAGRERPQEFDTAKADLERQAIQCVATDYGNTMGISWKYMWEYEQL
jgi:hypothetical protein